jgi:Na+/H+ antiporter NhaC
VTARRILLAANQSTAREERPMFLILAIVLVVLWLMGAFVFRVMGGLVHIVLVIALIALAVHFLRGHP